MLQQHARRTKRRSKAFVAELQKVEPDSGVDPYTRVLFGAAYAGLGEAASAIAEGQKAIGPAAKFQKSGIWPRLEDEMARIYAQLGDADHAIPMLKRLLRTTVCRCDAYYSGDTATRSDLGSNPQRSAFSRLGGKVGKVTAHCLLSLTARAPHLPLHACSYSSQFTRRPIRHPRPAYVSLG